MPLYKIKYAATSRPIMLKAAVGGEPDCFLSAATVACSFLPVVVSAVVVTLAVVVGGFVVAALVVVGAAVVVDAVVVGASVVAAIVVVFARRAKIVKLLRLLKLLKLKIWTVGVDTVVVEVVVLVVVLVVVVVVVAVVSRIPVLKFNSWKAEFTPAESTNAPYGKGFGGGPALQGSVLHLREPTASFGHPAPPNSARRATERSRI